MQPHVLVDWIAGRQWEEDEQDGCKTPKIGEGPGDWQTNTSVYFRMKWTRKYAQRANL